MSKDQNKALPAFVAFRIAGKRYGVKTVAGERVGEFEGTKEEAQAEAERLIAALPPAAPADEKVTGKGDGVEDENAGITGQGAQLPNAQLAELAGVLSGDGTVIPLADMPEPELRQLGLDMEITDSASLPLEQLIAAIQAEKINVADLGEPGQQLLQESELDDELDSGDGAIDHSVIEHQYLVNRERLEHDGETYTFGDPIVIEDWAQAKLLLDRRAIVFGDDR